jgi:hypothetical protein
LALERLEGGCNIFRTLDFKFGDLDAEVAGSVLASKIQTWSHMRANTGFSWRSSSS